MELVLAWSGSHALTGVLVETVAFDTVPTAPSRHALTGVLVETGRSGMYHLCICHALTGVLVETL